MANKKQVFRDIAYENFNYACLTIRQHPILAPLFAHTNVIRRESNLCPKNAWAVVTSNGNIHVHPTRRGEPDEWIYVLAHCLLHLGFGHFQEHKKPREWNYACDRFVCKFLAELKLGRPPEEYLFFIELSARTEDKLYQELCDRGIPENYHSDMIFELPTVRWWGHKIDWQACFGQGLVVAVTSAVNVAAGVEPVVDRNCSSQTNAQRAKAWFISSYPLIGALAASFEIIEDPLSCQRLDISVAAVDAQSKEIFINPAAGLDEYESRFVMAHELLHVGLSHQARRQGRDPYLWNVACDYVINSWLVEIGLGELPKVGVLYDVELKGESSEAIYDRLVTDMRRYRKLATLRGIGVCDILERGTQNWWAIGDGIDLDEFYRRCLTQGLNYHQEQGRGFLPAGLVEEIRALNQPPIPWDVELAQWFDNYFSPLAKVRTYARPSRRQSSTPDIPRPRWLPAVGADDERTFGVVLDTSGSMDRELLAKALGAIASYSISREVSSVRVVFCDAIAYDQGYMPPELIADRVKVKGRGGTVLQPGIDLLETAKDFPKNGPLLIITDGECDRLRIRNEHAFLIPESKHLPFVPKGKVFRIR